MTTVLEFRDVKKSYKSGTPVVDGVTFNMAEGDVVGLIGRNGAGKTTLIRIAIGMLYPGEGTVRIFGLSPTDKPIEVKKRIGYVAEDQVLPPGSNAAELIAFHKWLFPSWDSGLERQLMDRFGLSPKNKISSLSKGQARQVALLCAVCHRPELLILDEPAAGLDPATRREFLETSIQLLNREGSAILFSSHQMSDVERLGGRVVLIDHGKVLLDRETAALSEEICVATVSRASVHDAVRLENVPGCLRVRAVLDSWHLVISGTPERAKEAIEAALHVPCTSCIGVPLEELFIEMVGGERK